MLPIIETRGTPREMGQQYGEATRTQIHLTQDLWQEWFEVYPITAHFQKCARACLSEYAPEILEELEGLAEGADISFDFLLAINFTDTFDNQEERCTPLFLRHSPQGVIVAKNNDAGVRERYPFVIRKGSPNHGIPFIQVTYAGWLSGLDMINGAGLMNTHGSVGSIFPRPAKSLDIRLRMYQLMQSRKTARELAEGLHQIPLTGKGFSIAIGDEREAFFLEAAVPKLAIRGEQEKFAWSTNLYRVPELRNADMRAADRRAHCQNRFEYIQQQRIPQDLTGIQALLRDHSAPAAPCRHGGEQLSVTAWSMIGLPKERKLLVTDGNPCCNPYMELTL